MKKIAAFLLILIMITALPMKVSGELTPTEKQRIAEYVKKINKEIEDCEERASSIKEDCDERFQEVVDIIKNLEERIDKIEKELSK